VDVLDMGDEFWRAKHTAPTPLFLKTDTHWSPAGMEQAARLIAARVEPLLGRYNKSHYEVQKYATTPVGDLVTLLQLPPGPTPFPDVEVEYTFVQGTDKAEAGEEPMVLLMGDSFAADYDTSRLPAQLARRLGTGVQYFGAPAMEGMENQRSLAQQPGVLANKKVVVFEFVTRCLSHRLMEWENVAFPRVVAPPPGPGRAEGSVEVAGPLVLSGWAWDKSRPDQPVNVDVFDGSSLLATLTACLPRPDLLGRGIGNGEHGFHYRFPARLMNGKAHTIRVTFSGTDRHLAGSPRTVRLP
jgi:hypothetical protein